MTSPDQISDQRLIEAVAGHQPALEQLLENCGAEVRGVVSSDLPMRWQALVSLDDIMQQTYTDAFLGITRFRESSVESFRHWLVRLARRNIQDAVRLLEAQKRGGGRIPISTEAQGSSFERLFERLTMAGTTPSRHVARAELKDLIASALTQLPELHRFVVEAIDLQSRSVVEVADQLDRSRGAVHMIRARAHRWLAEILGGGSFSSSA
jgi:RNA polymerase sigma factor (sigma-70 family)